VTPHGYLPAELMVLATWLTSLRLASLREGYQNLELIQDILKLG
jgi:hypothetical protein